MSFLRAKSPVTPKITMPHGPAIRGIRLSRLSTKGVVPAGGDRRGHTRTRLVRHGHFAAESN